MAHIRRAPPGGFGQRSDGNVSADSFDTPNLSPPTHPRKRASAPRPLGPGERAAARACHEHGFRVIEGERS